MKKAYCYFCDAPAAVDPCPRCGRRVHRSPAKGISRSPEESERALVARPAQGPRMRARRLLAVAVALAVAAIVLFVLRPGVGIG